MNIYQKLQSCRVRLQKMNLKKSGENKFAKFKYYELSDFLPAINELFDEFKLFDHFGIDSEKAVLTIIDTEADTNAEPVTFTMPIAAADVKGATPIQSLGAQNTYLRRYLYMNALDIVENDTLDPLVGQGQNNKKERSSASPQPAPQKKEVDLTIPTQDEDIHTGITAIGDLEELKIYYNELKDHVLNKQAFNVAISQKKQELTKKGEINNA